MTVVLVLGLELLMNHIGIDDQDTMGSSVGSFDGMNYAKKPVGSLTENILKKRTDVKMARSGCGP